jgi:dTDP-4-amino-4,6-dideoxygalactose transaminase
LIDPSAKLKLPTVPEGSISVWAQYAILAESSSQRSAILKKLNDHQIPAAIYYSLPIHLQRAALGHDYAKGDFPVSEACADRIFSIPFHPYLTEKDQKRIADAINRSCITPNT